jgi:hypothetical protein
MGAGILMIRVVLSGQDIATLQPLGYSEAVREVLAAYPGLVWDPNLKAYKGGVELVEIAAAHLESCGLARVSGTITPEDTSAVSLALPEGLREYQRDGVRWILRSIRTRGAALLTDEIGVGKSAQAAVAGTLYTLGPKLVICPAIVAPHWRAQLSTWAPGGWWRVLSYEKTLLEIRNKRIEPAELVVLDEIHYLSDPKAKRSEEIGAWLGKGNDRPAIIGLSGTPMTARPINLWHPLEVLFPKRFGGWWRFSQRYADGHYTEVPGVGEVWEADGVSHAEELGARLARLTLRRTKIQVLDQLPERTRTVIEIDLPGKPIALGELPKHGAHIRDALALYEGAKADGAVALAEGVMAGGGRPLILTTRRETAEKIAAKIFGAICAHGEMPPERRYAALADKPVGVSTMYAVTTGIDLTSYDALIFVGLDWVPSTLLQAEGRLYRSGQKKAVTVYYLIARGTLDEVIRSRVIARLDTFSTIVGQGDETHLGAALTTEGDLLAGLLEDIRQWAS